MATYQGKRVDLGKGVHTFKPCEYGKAEDGSWYACTPNDHLGNLSGHEVTEHPDGTITVSSSILVSKGLGDKGKREVWHGYLEKGVWRDC